MAIKQIKDSAGNIHDIDAKYWAGHEFSEITDLVHGVVDTYVIPTTKSSTSGYSTIVGATSAQVSTTGAILKGLVSNPPSGDVDVFGVGDMILMGATSDGSKNFDRWVSNVSGTGDSAVITLDVLETQVATHHHTITITSGTALTNVRPTNTTANVAKVGSDKTVVVSGKETVVTGVAYNGSGSHNIVIATATSTDSGAVGHSHTVTNHSHKVTLGQANLVKASVNAYTSLTSAYHTPHTHSGNVTAAGAATNSTSFKYVNDGSTETFIKTLKDSAQTTGCNTAGLTTNNNTAFNTGNNSRGGTTVQISSNASCSVLTGEGGGHSHSLSSAQTDTVVKSATVAGSVITSVNFSKGSLPVVQETVVKSVTSVSKNVVTSATLTGTKTFLTTWSATVDDSGILSFSRTSGTVGINAPTAVISAVGGVSTGTQSAGSLPSLNFTSAAQSVSTGKVAVSGTIATNGTHQHGFTHTHTIDTHTHSVGGHSHTIASHTHSYNKSVQNGTGNAYTSLTSASYTPHTHANSVTAAGAPTNSASFKYVSGGSVTSVVQSLVDNAEFTTTGSAPSTNTKYHKITGSITVPGLNVTIVSTTSLLTTGTVKQAADSGEKAIKSITLDSASFIKTVTGKTSTNKGGA